MTFSRRLLVVLLIGVASALAGCAGGKPPTFTLERVLRAGDRAEDAAKIEFVFAGHNPTKKAYPLREVAYSVRIDGRTVFQGVRSAQVTLPPFESREFTIPAPIPYEEVGRIAGRNVRYEVSGSVAWLPPGPIADILYDMGVHRRRVKFSDGGMLEVPPDLTPESLRRQAPPPAVEPQPESDPEG